MEVDNEFGRWQQYNRFVRVVGRHFTGAEQATWLFYFNHADIDGYTNISKKTIADERGVAPKNLRETVDNLIAKGALHKDENTKKIRVEVEWKGYDNVPFSDSDLDSKGYENVPFSDLEQQQGAEAKGYENVPFADSDLDSKGYENVPSEGTKTYSKRVRKRTIKGTKTYPLYNRTEKRKTECPDSGNRDGFEIFKKEEKRHPQDDPMAEWDMMIAVRLKNAVHKHLGPGETITPKANMAAWADQVRMLRVKDTRSPKQIEFALNWYINNMRGKYAFKCYSTESFRKKFTDLVNKLQYEIPYLGLDLEPDADADAAHSRLSSLGWPKGSTGDLYLAYQISRNRYKDFRKRITEYAATLKPWVDYTEIREQCLARLVEGLADRMPGSSEYTERYFEHTVFPRVVHWEKWDGNLAMFLIDPDGKDFQQQGHVWSKEITGSEKWWNELMDEINKDAETCK